jgi:hypothetical protein
MAALAGTLTPTELRVTCYTFITYFGQGDGDGEPATLQVLQRMSFLEEIVIGLRIFSGT